ncbi:MAG: rRNA ((1498)-N(3))-methyltransferase [Vampirovibrio sp.]|jgi:16S rRNA (uracil1498-N3)-methyltransferase|nr:rRNA ((1498)-N(3))-methyltransferase [Vampirovibrio sp.]
MSGFEKHDDTAKRFFVSLTEPLEQFPADIEVTDDIVVHHLRTVMRARTGESVVIVDGQRGQAYAAVLQDLQKHSVSLRVQRKLETLKTVLPQAVLAVALIKEQRWDWLLQKATELGVHTIQPLLADRTVIRLGDKDISKKLERWQAVLRSAAEQSEGLFIPQIMPPLSTNAYLGQMQSNTLKLILRERGEHRQSLKQALKGFQTEQAAIFAIGPGGGWTDSELDAFEQAGFLPVSLGTRILRSETAAVAAMAALVYEFT